MVFVSFLSLKQRLSPLGYCASPQGNQYSAHRSVSESDDLARQLRDLALDGRHVVRRLLVEVGAGRFLLLFAVMHLGVVAVPDWAGADRPEAAVCHWQPLWGCAVGVTDQQA